MQKVIVAFILSILTLTTFAPNKTFCGMAAANIGSCGVGGCAVSTRSASKQTEDIAFEEVVSKK